MGSIHLYKNLYISFIMSSFEFNKIFAAIVLALIVFVIIDKVGDFFINTDKVKLKETAYKIEIPQSNVSSEISTELQSDGIELVSSLLESASLENGEKIYKKCGSCHNYEKDSKSKIGPNLWNIVNSLKASSEGFAYSNALTEFGGTWNFEELNNFLYNPKKYIQGTKMNFGGLKKVEDRADLILWLRQNSDNPVPLP